MTILDISQEHERKYVAFGTTIKGLQHIIASDTVERLLCFFADNKYCYVDFSILNNEGKLVEAFEYYDNRFIRVI